MIFVYLENKKEHFVKHSIFKRRSFSHSVVKILAVINYLQNTTFIYFVNAENASLY